MKIRQITPLVTILLVLTSITFSTSLRPTVVVCNEITSSLPINKDLLSESVNIVENSGFETGTFAPWINLGDTSYNQIQSSLVYSGSYALYMDSHLSSVPYEPVYQDLAPTLTLADNPNISAVVYPAKVGPTAGQAGVSHVSIGLNNTVTGVTQSMTYQWSGYTYPGGDMGVNVTSKVMYLLFDWTPNQWNILDRNLLSDYIAFFGEPANASEIVFRRITLISHISNGDPGDFWIDDLEISPADDEPTPPDFNYIKNPGFETGSFSPWVNEGGTAYNQIVGTTVYAGNYSCYLDSHFSSAPYEPITQRFVVNATLSEGLSLSAAIYPTKVGNTCGQAGASAISIWFQNTSSGQISHLAYEWSGYTFPGNDLNSNITYVRFLLFDWTPNSWNILNRSVYDDYVAFWGVPSNMSQIEFYRVHTMAHSSNGDPGDFWIDNVKLGAPYVEPPPEPVPEPDPDPDPIPSDFNHVENPGFETGTFSPWVNQRGTTYNQIVGSIVYEGSYSCYLDSHISSSPYEPVTQRLTVNATLNETLTVSAAIYPTKVGNTCGQAGVSQIGILFHNKATDQYSHIAYEWSGYTFPGNDLNSNNTYVRYLLFDWIPNSWNILNRSVYDDYVAFWGVPGDPSQIEFYDVRILCHSSNGDPGDFYIDNVHLGTGQAPEQEPPPTTTTTTTTPTTTSTTSTTTNTGSTSTTPTDTTSPSTSTPTNYTSPDGDWMMLVFVGGGGMGVIIIVVIIILTKKGGSAGSTSAQYEW